MKLPRLKHNGPSRIWAVFALIWAVCAGCGPSYVGPPPDTPEGRLEMARQLIERGQHYDALLELQAFTSENPGSGYLDKALFYMGRAYLGKRDHAMAAAEFERLLREFPGSEHASEARFLLGVSYYEQSLPAQLDPTMTVRAIDQFRLFMKLHPDSPFMSEAQEKVDELRGRMAEKRYLNGKLYLRLKEPAAARFYFERIIDEYPDSPWAPKSMLEIAKSYEIEKEMERAIDQYRELIRVYPDSEEAGQARLRVEELGAGAPDLGPDLAGEGSEGVSGDPKP